VQNQPFSVFSRVKRQYANRRETKGKVNMARESKIKVSSSLSRGLSSWEKKGVGRKYDRWCCGAQYWRGWRTNIYKKVGSQPGLKFTRTFHISEETRSFLASTHFVALALWPPSISGSMQQDCKTGFPSQKSEQLGPARSHREIFEQPSYRATKPGQILKQQNERAKLNIIRYKGCSRWEWE